MENQLIVQQGIKWSEAQQKVIKTVVNNSHVIARMPRRSGKTLLAVGVAMAHVMTDKLGTVTVLVTTEANRFQFIAELHKHMTGDGGHRDRIKCVAVSEEKEVALPPANFVIIDDAERIWPETFFKCVTPICQQQQTRILFARKIKKKGVEMELLSSWTAGPLILLVWSTKALLWVCDCSSNKLLVSAATPASRGVFSFPPDYDVVLFAYGDMGVTRTVFGGIPILVYNMVNADASLLARVKPMPGVTIVSLNKPAHIAAAAAVIVWLKHEDMARAQSVLSPFVGNKSVSDLMMQTRDMGVPPDFDPAYDLLFAAAAAEDELNLASPSGSGEMDYDVFFCGNRGCSNQAQSAFDCLKCGVPYCSDECKETTCSCI